MLGPATATFDVGPEGAGEGAGGVWPGMRGPTLVVRGADDMYDMIQPENDKMWKG